MCLHILCRNNNCPAAARGSATAATGMVRWRIAHAVCLCAFVPASHAAWAQDAAPVVPEAVIAHGNTHPAGTVKDDEVRIRMRAARGTWRPEGPKGAAIEIEALGEEGTHLTVPAPPIRVKESATLTVSVRNDLPAPLRLHGLCARDGGACAPLDVKPGATETVRFTSGRAGTYHYWATSLGAPMPMREMAGALIVDPKDAAERRDRIFVITEWNTLMASELAEILSADLPSERFLALRPAATFVINGLSWPATERLTYQRGETVRWRVINLSSQTHPMHLHGFYFTVLTAGDGRQDAPVAQGRGERVVTHLLPSGGTMLMEWTPEQEGNWLLHCHIMSHVSRARRLTGGTVPVGDPLPDHAHAHGRDDPGLGMAGMVLGITVLPERATSHAPADRPVLPPRRLTMRIERTTSAGGASAIGVAFTEQGNGAADPHPASPGPPLVLVRGEPVEITVVNALTEPTSIHWHGLEIESYYDGVHGWSGVGRRTAPMIEPGGSFVVRITPPREGTFIYHTHLHDYLQLSSGLYGAVIVTEPGSTFDPAVDHVLLLGRQNASEASAIVQDAASVVINGDRAPRWTWRAGTRHRIRVINITPDDVLTVSALKGDAVLEWRAVMKDGAPVSMTSDAIVPARVRIAVGETYDFELDAPPGRGAFWIEVRSPSGKWQAQAQVFVR